MHSPTRSPSPQTRPLKPGGGAIDQEGEFAIGPAPPLERHRRTIGECRGRAFQQRWDDQPLQRLMRKRIHLVRPFYDQPIQPGPRDVREQDPATESTRNRESPRPDGKNAEPPAAVRTATGGANPPDRGGTRDRTFPLGAIMRQKRYFTPRLAVSAEVEYFPTKTPDVVEVSDVISADVKKMCA